MNQIARALLSFFLGLVFLAYGFFLGSYWSGETTGDGGGDGDWIAGLNKLTYLIFLLAL